MEYREIDKWSIVDLTKEDVCSNCSKVVKKGELTRYTIFNEQKEVCEYCLFKLDKEVHENLSEVGYVYFLKEFNSNNVKIGKTKNLKHRVTTLKSMLPYKSELIHYIITPKYSVTETFFHNLFQGKKVKGEWFNLEPDDINFIINFKEIEVCV
nr:GIY-YIG nuclease family protein [Fictibacillus sp. 18YEL24]